MIDEDDDDDEEPNNGLGDIRGTMMMFQKNNENEKEFTLEDFEIKGVIGRGTFGKVFLG